MTRILGVLGLLVVLYVALVTSHPNAGKADNLIDVANLQGRYGIITLGAALVIITGGIDLSIGSVVGCAAVLFGVLMEAGVHPYAGRAHRCAVRSAYRTGQRSTHHPAETPAVPRHAMRHVRLSRRCAVLGSFGTGGEP